MRVLQSFIEESREVVSCWIIRFLHAFISEASLVEPHEVDNFILRNSEMLCMWLVIFNISTAGLIASSAWESYAIQVPILSQMRPTLLVRVLSVDVQPFQDLIHLHPVIFSVAVRKNYHVVHICRAGIA